MQMSVDNALLLSAILSCMYIHTCTSQAVNTFYVTPNASTTPCPPGPCYEFKTYYLNSSFYFQSNTQFIFLPGVHLFDLGDLLLVQDKFNISLVGSANLTVHTVAEKVKEYGFDQYAEDDNITYFESLTKIQCSYQSGFAFANISNLVLANFSVVSCGHYYSLTSFTAGVHLFNVRNLLMDGVSIQNSTGYGLLGDGLLGQYSMIMQSSFIANNQYVKDMLQKMTVPGLSCSSNNYTYNSTVYVNNGSVKCQSAVGGNVFLIMDVIGEFSVFNLKNLIFALGLDGTFTNELSIACIGYGTGLAINFESGYDVIAYIESTVFYRNQAFLGANLNLMVEGICKIELNSIRSIRGVAMAGGAGVYANFMLPVAAYGGSLSVTDSIFECNYVHQSSWELGSSMDISFIFSDTDYTFMSASFENCTFRNDAGFSFIKVDVTSFAVGEFVSSLYLNGTVITNVHPSTCSYSCFLSQIHDIGFDNSELNGNDVAFLFSSVGIENSNFTSSRVTGVNSTISLYGLVVFSNSSDVTNGGALYLSSTIVFVAQLSQVFFLNNRALYGGSIFVDSYSQLVFASPCNVSFINNSALITGGAIYVQTAPQSSQALPPPCFFQISNFIFANVQLYFKDNHAGDAGSVLYGSDIDNCIMLDCSTLSSCNSGAVFDAIFIDGGNNTIPNISSDPTSVCPCNESCLKSTIQNITVYPGQQIDIPFITVGQRNSIAPSVVILYTIFPNVEIISAFRTSNVCANYPVPFELANQTLLISTQSALVQTVPTEYIFEVIITVLPCPTCFMPVNNSCTCNDLLSSHRLECYISNQTAQTKGNQWVSIISSNRILAVFDQCPFDYCSNTGIINLTHFDSQCNYGRTDVLCGKCQLGLSATFGTSQCKDCSNYYLLLIIPFTIMGLALVAVLFVLNLTVSAGTLNGMIFYANIFRINDNIFFPAKQRSPLVEVLSTTIAWFNLDFGIEVCFYDGMDSYAKTWLQFVFPLYILTLVGAIIVLGRYSSLISRLCRFNAVPVLATLILLSYSKILRIIITIFSPAALETENFIDVVWLYDGNVHFLEPKHAALFVFGMSVLIFFVVPYTILLLVAPCLQARSHWRCFHWINRIKPFLDCYQAPFKDKYRFWSGVLLLGRMPLYLLFTLENDPTFKLWGIMIAMYLYTSIMTSLSVYKSWFLLVLEMLFITNMTAIVAATLLHLSTGFSIAGAIVFLLSVCGVVIYHAFHQCKRISWLWLKMKPSTNETQPLANGVSDVGGKYQTSGADTINSEEDFREPLLHDDS